MPVFGVRSSAVVTNDRPMTILTNFSNIFEGIIIHDQLSFYFKFKFHPPQHGFMELKYTAATNLLTCLKSITLSVSSQGQANPIYFDLSKAFE
jgi:hypothetical protein